MAVEMPPPSPRFDPRRGGEEREDLVESSPVPGIHIDDRDTALGSAADSPVFGGNGPGGERSGIEVSVGGSGFFRAVFEWEKKQKGRPKHQKKFSLVE